MKVIDLLNKIVNGEEVPKKIKYDDDIYEFKRNDYERTTLDFNSYTLLYDMEYITKLNDEVEIIEETQKIPRLSFQQIGSKNLEKGNYFRFVEDINKQIGGLGKKINDLIDEVNELKGGLNGN